MDAGVVVDSSVGEGVVHFLGIRYKDERVAPPSLVYAISLAGFETIPLRRKRIKILK